jgi:hypothetical protein
LARWRMGKAMCASTAYPGPRSGVLARGVHHLPELGVPRPQGIGDLAPLLHCGGLVLPRAKIVLSLAETAPRRLVPT